MNSVFNNASRLNNFIVRNGLSISEGNAASAYVLCKKLEKKLNNHINNIRDNYKQSIGFVKISKYLEDTKYTFLSKTNSLKDTIRLNEYLVADDFNNMIYKVTGRNIDKRIQTILKRKS